MRLSSFKLRWAPDISMLAWPGWRGRWARARFRWVYGDVDLERFFKYASTRHQRWIKEGQTLTLRRNWRGTQYVHNQEA